MKTIFLSTTIPLLMIFSLFALWYFRLQRSQTHPLIKGTALSTAKTPVTNQRDASRWSFINSWQVAPQHDDNENLICYAAR